jgi:hypothetical protein
MCMGGGPEDNSREIEEQRQGRIREGMGRIDQTFAPFNDAYYQGLETTAMNTFEPDIDQQYSDAVRQATFALSRGGNLRSSAGADAMRRLRERRDTATIEGRDRARGIAGDRRREVEGTRNTLVSQLNSTADPTAAAQQAASQAALLTQPPAFSPIANIFGALTQQFADAQSYNRGGVRNWATGIFGAPSTGNRGSVMTS